MIGGFFRVTLEPFAGRPAIAAELAWGAITGVLLYLVFRRFSNGAAVRVWKRKRRAHVLSLFLFGDDPALSVRSLARIFQANAALLVHALPALLIAAPLAALIAVNLNEFFTRTPLADGGAAVLTVRLTRPCEASVQAPDWIEVDLPAVHVPAAHEMSWRIRAREGRSGRVEIACEGERVTKEIDARAEPRYFAKVREGGWAWLLHPGEERLPEGAVQRIALSESPGGQWGWCFGLSAWLTAVGIQALTVIRR